MRVAVLGGTGNVGTAVVAALQREDSVDEIVVVARRAPDGPPPASVHHVTADIAVDDLTPHLRGCDAVIHLAWLMQPTHAPMTTWRVNVDGSSRVFEATVAAGAGTLVYASSVGAYSPVPPPGAPTSSDGRSHRRDEPVDESWPTHSTPTAHYGREKAYVERLLDTVEARNPSLRVVRLRPGFTFQRASATEQRRLAGGPFVPRLIARRGVLPFVPVPRGFRMQVVHAADIAEAYRLALVSDVRGPFNVAADPVLDGHAVAAALGTRAVQLPRPLVRGALAAAWHLHLTPADPALLDLAIDLPIMSTERARVELGWRPRRSAHDALNELVAGVAEGAGGDTPPLAPDTGAERVEELRSGVGERPS